MLGKFGIPAFKTCGDELFAGTMENDFRMCLTHRHHPSDLRYRHFLLNVEPQNLAGPLIKLSGNPSPSLFALFSGRKKLTRISHLFLIMFRIAASIVFTSTL